MKKQIEQVVKILIYLSFFVPLAVFPTSFIFPFIVPKILIFRTLVTIMIGGYVLLMMINWEEYRPRMSWINLVLALFLLSFAASTFVGVDWYHSFWDNHERMLGLFTIVHYISYYFICTALFRNWDDWRLALRIFLIAGSIVMFIGALQKIDPEFLINRGDSRVASTLGNSIYVGGYGLFLLFLSFLMAVKEKTRGYWFYAEIAMGVLALLGLFFSGSRGPVIGLLAGAGVSVIGYIIVIKGRVKIRQGLIGVLILGVVLTGLLIGFRKTTFVAKIPAIGRTVNTSFTDVQKSPRWAAWEIAVDSWKEKPVFGWGPNNYFFAFNKYYNPRLLDFGYGETWFDNAHNIILNTLAVQGAFGFVSYLSIFGVGIFVLWRAYKKEDVDYHIVVVGTAFLVAHLVQNVTVFENPTSYLYFMVWMALLNSFTMKKAKEQNNNKIGMGSISVAAVLVFCVIFVFNVQPARANNKSLNAIRHIRGYSKQSLTLMKETLEFSSPHIDDIRADLGRNVNTSFNDIYKGLGQEESLKVLDLAFVNHRLNIELHPYDIRNQITVSQLARLLAIITKDTKYLIEAEKYMEDALEKSPKRQQVLYALASFKIEVNKGSEAIKYYEQAINDNPRVAESYWRMAYAYSKLGKIDKAHEVIELANKNNVVFDTRGKQAIMEIFPSSTPKVK